MKKLITLALCTGLMASMAAFACPEHADAKAKSAATATADAESAQKKTGDCGKPGGQCKCNRKSQEKKES